VTDVGVLGRYSSRKIYVEETVPDDVQVAVTVLDPAETILERT
jgi:hypothetical protein